MQQVFGKPSRGYLLALLFLIQISVSGQAEGAWFSKEAITDLTNTPIYPRLVEGAPDGSRWNSEYAYLDSIEMFRIQYLSDGIRVNGLLVQPREPGIYPCIIYNRGGNRDFGALKVYHAVSLMGKIASEGFIVIASNYRGNGGGEGQEEFGGSDVNDVLQLINVLGELEKADTARIGMMGWSRGGMMTYLALAHTHKIKAAAVGGALADLTTGDRPELEEKVYRELIPAYETNRDSVLKIRSAVFWPEKLPKTTPILIMHGNADWRVKSTQSLRLAMALDRERVPYRLIIFEGADHGISEFRDEVTAQAIKWFHRYLINDEEPPDMEYHGR